MRAALAKETAGNMQHDWFYATYRGRALGMRDWMHSTLESLHRYRGGRIGFLCAIDMYFVTILFIFSFSCITTVLVMWWWDLVLLPRVLFCFIFCEIYPLGPMR
jgi:hypothetical protein